MRAASAAEVAERLGAVSAPLVLCGHTHMPRLARSGATLVVNPGSVGLPAFDDTNPYPHRMETGSPHARWALVERSAAGWQARLIAHGLRLGRRRAPRRTERPRRLGRRARQRPRRAARERLTPLQAVRSTRSASTTEVVVFSTPSIAPISSSSASSRAVDPARSSAR